MAVRLYSEFKSDNGKQYKIEIHDANWLAASTEFNVDSRGFELIYEGETDDIVSPIVSSRLQFGAYSANATFETFIDTLKTFQENRFQIAVYKYNGTSYDLYWAGWILQDLVSVEDASQPYIYELTATDGLGRLANVEYTSANTIIETNGLQLTRVTDVVKTALNNIGTSNLWGSSDVFFETAADWWETNAQTYSTSVDPIANQAFDVRYFREFDDDGNVVYSSTLEILRQIATLYNGRFYMQNGRFVFEQYGNRDTASRYVSRYTKTGTAISRTSVSDDVTINQTDDAARTSGNNWNFLPAAQKAKIHYVQKFLNPFNAFGLYRFRLATNAFTAGFIAGGSGVQLALGSTQFNLRVVGAASLTSPIFPVFKMRIRIQDSSTGTYYYYNRAYNGVVAGGAMFGTAAWSTTAGEYFFDLPPFFTSGVAIVKNPVQIVTADIPVNGEIDFRLQLHGVFRSKNGTTYTPSQPAAFDAIFVFGIQTNGASNAPGATFSSTNSEAGIDSKLTIDLGDLVIADGPIQTGHLSVYNGSAWTGSSDWRKGSSGSSLPILKLLTNETLALHVRPIEQYNGTFSLSAFFGQRLLFNSAAYLMTSGTFTANDDQWSSTLYKIETIRASVTPVDPVDDLVDRTSLIATTTTDGSSPNDIIGGRIGGMVVDIEDQKVGPFQQTGTGARITGTMNVTGDVTLDAGLDVDGVSQFNNDVNITGSVTSTGPLTGEYVQLDTTYNTTPVQGQIVWSQDDGTIDVGLNSNVTMQVGQEQFWYVKNQTGSTIAKGTAVRAAGTLGASGRILAAPMIADGSVPARFFLGIAAENIVNGGEGYVTTFGKIRQLNTSAYTEGSVLWCNPAVAGGLTSTEPAAPNLKLAVAFVVRSNATSGVLAVRSEIGARVSDASDVQVTSVADNDLLQYNTTTSRWENVAGTTTNIGEGTNLYYTDGRARAAISETIDGISYNNTTGVFSLDANRVIVTTTQTGEWDTAYNDRIVSAAVAGTTTKTLTLTQGDGGTITASWTDYDTAPVTSVNGQTGVVVLTTDNINEGTSNLYYTDGRARASLSAGVGITYNNTTGVITNSAPDQVVALTASTGIAITGTYPNFTITNTAPSSGGTITGGGTTNYLSKWTSGSALGNSLVFDNGSSVGIGTTTFLASDYRFVVRQATNRNFAIASQDGELSLEPYNDTPAGIPMRIYGSRVSFPNGKLLVGTTTDNGYQLDVKGGNASTLRLNNDGSQYVQLLFERNSTSNTGGDILLDGTNGTFGLRSLAAYPITFSTSIGTGGSERMRITPGGTLLVGHTTTPVETAWLGTAVFGKDTYNKVIIGSLNSVTTGAYVGGHNSALNAWADLNVAGTNVIFRTEQVERMRLASDGNVGIGTTAPFSKTTIAVPATNTISADDQANTAGLTIAGSDALVRLQLGVGSNLVGPYGGWIQASYDNGGVDYGVEPLVLNPVGGNVGIGTTLPMGPLEVYKANTSGLGGHIILNNNGQAVGNETAVLFNDSGAGSVGYVRAAISSSVEGSPYYGDLKFKTGASSYASLNTRMIITGAGNVGIGTTSPGAKLEIAGTSSTFALSFGNSVPNNPLFVNTYGGFTGIGMDQTTAGLRLAGDSGGNNLVDIGYYSSNVVAHANWVSRMRVFGNGKVGIGTTNPIGYLTIKEADTSWELNTDADAVYQLAYNRTTSAYKIMWMRGSSFVFAPNDVEKVRIASNGNFGVGTTNPIAKFVVSDAGANGIEFNPNYLGESYIATYDRANSVYRNINIESNEIRFRTGGSATLRGIIDSSGNFGIGTITPQLTNAGRGNVTINGSSDSIAVLSIADEWKSYWYVTSGASYLSSQGNRPFYFETNNGVRMGIMGNGNVGIGTTAPMYKFVVQSGTGINSEFRDDAGNALAIRTLSGRIDFLSTYEVSAANMDMSFTPTTSGGVQTEAMRIQASTGNVGIGTTSPDARLQIRSASAPSFNVSSVNALKVEATTGAAAGEVGAGIVLAQRWWNGAPNQLIETAGIYGFKEASDGNYGGGMLLATLPNSAATMVERLRITAGGNVGIGTTAPQSIFEVAQSTPTISITSTIAIESTTNNQTLSQFIFYKHYGLAQGAKIAMLQSGGMYNYPQAHLAFFTNDGSGGWSAPSERMRIKDNGNVGIGTTDPGTKLDVAGVTRSGAFLTTDATTTSIPIDTGGSKAYFDASNINGPAITLRADSVGRTIRMYDGTSSVAAIDANSGGLYIATNSSHPIRFAPNASEAMRIAVGGNVGIGTTAPITNLHVQGTNTEQVLISYDSSKRMLLGRTSGYGWIAPYTDGVSYDNLILARDGGNVGIGTTSPSEKLHVAGNVIVTYNNSYQGINSIGNKAILARVSPTTGIINYAEYATAANLNGFVIGSDDARVKGNIATDSLEFITNTSTRMFINSSGNVGIGTTSPARSLHVTGDVQFNDQGSMPSNQYVPDGAYGIDNLITNGAENVALGKPDVWLRIYVDGNAYVFPGYTQ